MKKAVAYLIPFIEEEKAKDPAVTRRQGHQRHHRDGDGQGRRPRHRQEHRRRRAAVQQLRGHRPRRDGAGAEDPRHRRRGRGRPDRAVRPDHALARRDGQLRQRDAAPRAVDPAAGGRRDDESCAHRGQGRPEVRRPGGLGEGRLPVGRRRVGPPQPDRPRQADGRRAGRLRLAAHPPRRQARPADGDATPRRATTRRRSTGRATTRRRRASLGVTRLRRLRHRRAARLHRLAAVLQRVGDEGQVPRHPQQPVDLRGGAQALRRRPGDARPDRRREVAHGSRGGGALPRGVGG